MNELFRIILDDIKTCKVNSLSNFGFKERMKLERTLFIILNQLCKYVLNYEVPGFSNYYKEEILNRLENSKNHFNIGKIIIRIFEFKFNMQLLCSESAYVRSDILSKIGSNRLKIFNDLENQINGIHKLIINLGLSEIEVSSNILTKTIAETTNPLFISIPISAKTFNLLIQNLNFDKFNNKILWVANENLHITLFYLGNVQRNLLSKINMIIKKVISTTQPFTLLSKNLNFVKNSDGDSLLILQLSKNNDFSNANRKLFLELDKCIDFKQDCIEIIPHITLAKIKNTQASLLNTDINMTGRFSITVNKVELIESIYETKKIYRKIHTFPLEDIDIY